eukprot:4281594-Karenia_brevis.AAC.1
MGTDAWTQMYGELYNRPIAQENILSHREFRTEKQKALHKTAVRDGDLGAIYESPDCRWHP